MTTGEIVAAVYDRLSDIENIEMFDIMNRVDWAHKFLHMKLRFRESLVTDTFTWATTDGVTKTPTLTRWAGRPQRIWEGTAPAYDWVSYPVETVEDFQVNATSIDPTHRIYAIKGESLIIVAAPSSDLSVSVRHFPYPADLNDDTDTPTIPTEFHSILVLAAERDMWERAYALETNPTLKRGFLDKFTIADKRYESTYRQLVAYLSKQNTDEYDYEPPPLWRNAHIAANRRRQYARTR